MGNNMPQGQIKDKNIDIFVQTGKPVYVAGQFVDGKVHINCKQTRNYRGLRIKFQCNQKVFWIQPSNVGKYHNNNIQSYLSSFDLVTFASQKIHQGQYTFPFRFLLSNQFPGSCFRNQTFIRYIVWAELIPADNQNTQQSYSKIINILEPCRLPNGILQIKQQISPQSGCCCCISTSGPVKISMISDKMKVTSGDTINLSITIDNSSGMKRVGNIKIDFVEKIWRISNRAIARTRFLGEENLFKYEKDVHPGAVEKFNASVIIPKKYQHSTAIGTIFANYYTLKISTLTSSCCGFNFPYCQLYVIYSPQNPLIQISQTVKPPQGWNPKISNQVVCTTMNNFIYAPIVQLPFLNRGVNKIAQMQNINSINKLAEMNRMNGTNNNMNAINGYQSIKRMTPSNQGNIIMNQINYNNINITQQNLYEKHNTETSMY